MASFSTREQVVQLLRTHGSLTATDLVGILHITPTAVRQHLDLLEAEGAVEVTGLLRGRGRPRKVYALSSQSDYLFPHAYDALAQDLVEAIVRLPNGEQLLEQVLEARRQIWAERYADRLAGKSLDRQLDEVTGLFNEKGGLTEYALQPDGTYLLTKRHCNISTVTQQHHQFCQHERAWLQDVLHVPVESVHSRAAGDPACVFRIGPAKKSSAARRPGSRGKGA